VPPPATGERRAVLERVADAVERAGAGRRRVAVDGLTAAGKTTFGHELAVTLSRRGHQVLRATLDDFKHPWGPDAATRRSTGEGYYRHAYDYPRVRALLLDPAAPGGTGRVALCGIDPITQRDHSAETVAMEADAVLVVDGVFACRPELDDCWDLRVWLDVDEELSVRRGAHRDAARSGDEAAAAAQQRSRYLPSERLYVAECDPLAHADVVVDHRRFDRPVLVRLPA